MANERLKLFELLIRERLPPKSHRIVELRPGLSNRDGIVLAFVDIFDKDLEVLGAAAYS
jgi:hypothetical protein